MTFVDVNLLVYAVNSQASHHKAAKNWWESALSGGENIGLAWAVLLAFVRLTTMPGLVHQPLRVTEAFDLVQMWLEHQSVYLIEPGPRHLLILRDLLQRCGTAGNLTTDAHLAALAIEHNADLYSFDRDFARFPGLRWRDPLKRGFGR